MDSASPEPSELCLLGRLTKQELLLSLQMTVLSSLPKSEPSHTACFYTKANITSSRSLPIILLLVATANYTLSVLTVSFMKTNVFLAKEIYRTSAHSHVGCPTRHALGLPGQVINSCLAMLLLFSS